MVLSFNCYYTSLAYVSVLDREFLLMTCGDGCGRVHSFLKACCGEHTGPTAFSHSPGEHWGHWFHKGLPHWLSSCRRASPCLPEGTLLQWTNFTWCLSLSKVFSELCCVIGVFLLPQSFLVFIVVILPLQSEVSPCLHLPPPPSFNLHRNSFNPWYM